jgi:DNA repair protein SbcC/Rad50
LSTFLGQDQLRRRQLAEALGNLKSFQQLFGSSHDETFESMTENIIRVMHSE